MRVPSLRTNGQIEITQDDLLWLAGYLEGEGYFGVEKSMIDVSSTDLDIIERVSKIFGTHVGSYKDKTTTKKKQWRTYVCGHKGRVLMIKLLPLMGQRRQEKIKEALARHPRFLFQAIEEARCR